ncbi:MAG TPA: hypothetical protein VF302_02600 [Candidatus Limnocylindrales bacterium]
MVDPRRQAFDRLDRARRDACDAGDHETELERAAALVAAVDPRSTGDLILASLAHLQALEHLAVSAETDAGRFEALDRWLASAAAAHASLGRRLEEDEASPAARRAALDPVAGSLRRAQEAAGIDLSPPAADLARRERARGGPRPQSPTFFDRHRDGIAALCARDGRGWWQERFVGRFGSDPPDGWWRDGSASVAGGQVAPGRDAEEWFDERDQAEFFAEMEARYRAEMGLPARGEGWVSEIHLVRCVEAALPDVEIVRQARPPWLGGGQSLDILIPSLEVAIEYQGEQHYVALEHWGGEAGLAGRRDLDERKRDACLRAGVRLVEWRYDEPVTVAAVRARLRLIDE